MPPPRAASYLFRINTAKLLLELGQHETAAEVLDALLAEDDAVAQVWYMLGWAHHLLGDLPAAAGYFRKLQQVHAAVACDDAVRARRPRR